MGPNMREPMDPFASALEVARWIRNGERTPLEVARFYLDRIDRLNPWLNAIVWRDETFLERAEQATRIRTTATDLPPFFGVPLVVKDVQNVAGQPNTKSSLALSDAPQPVSDLFIERLLAAGFIPIGRSSSSELAASLSTESIKHGVTRNPWHESVGANGSSGGSAVAIAAGMVPAATATDGAGSTRLPAAACGLVGLKPSRGLLPQRVPNWEGSSVDGVLTRTVADTAALLDVTAAPDPYAWVMTAAPQPRYLASIRQQPTKLRVALLLDAPAGVEVDDECASAAREVAVLLEQDGHQVFTVSPNLIESPAIGLYRSFIGPAGSHLLDYDLSKPMQASVRRRLALIDEMSVRDYVRAVAEVKRLTRELIRPWVEDFDVMLTPTSAILTPPPGVVLDEQDNPERGQPTLRGLAAFTGWVNVAGLPAISLPTHLDSRGAPLGVQLIGGPFTESLLLQLGERLEQQYRWYERRPALTGEDRKDKDGHH